jgi:hypothetical protein
MSAIRELIHASSLPTAWPAKPLFRDNASVGLGECAPQAQTRPLEATYPMVFFDALRVNAGCDGVQVSFFDYLPDLEYFGREVLPLMRQAGLRNPESVRATGRSLNRK